MAYIKSRNIAEHPKKLYLIFSFLLKHWVATISFTMVVIFFAFSIFGQSFAPYNALGINILNRVEAPSFAHWMGTDQLGRDIFSRIIVGARPTAIVALTSIVIGGFVGCLLGVIAGYKGGKIDMFIMRIADASLSLPALLLAMVFSIVYGPGLLPVVATIAFLIWSHFARVVRSAAQVIRHKDWIKQAKVNGCSEFYIMWRHVLPHVVDVWLVMATLQVGGVILMEASLSFLGIGVPPPAPSWGQMAATGREYITDAWWIAIFPALALTLVIVAFNYLGDWVRDRFDPHE